MCQAARGTKHNLGHVFGTLLARCALASQLTSDRVEGSCPYVNLGPSGAQQAWEMTRHGGAVHC